MLVIKDHAALRALVTMAKEQDRFEPPGAGSSTGYLAPALAYLEELGGVEEFKFVSRVLLAAGSSDQELRFELETMQSDGCWKRQLSGVLRAELGPPLVFRLIFHPADAPSSAA